MPKIHFTGSPPVEHEQIMRNREITKSLNLPKAELGISKRSGRLAVVGGGPSVSQFIEQIRGYSEVWAVNGACNYLKGRGIASVLFAVDPHPIVALWARGVDRALCCDRCDPSVWDVLRGAKVETFSVSQDGPGGVFAGSSTASVAFHLGVERGWEFVDFFGCESSFEKKSHAYMDEGRKELLWVECGSKEYMTVPDFYLQATEMSVIIRSFRNNFRHFGGGLLEAMINDPEHDITYVSRDLYAQLKPAECLSS